MSRFHRLFRQRIKGRAPSASAACQPTRCLHEAHILACVPKVVEALALGESILEMLDEYSLPPWALELEITESILMYDIEKAAAKLLELEKIGISTAIDDFGTGYSSLNYLKVLPVRKLKIDRSFIMDLHVGRADEAIVRAIIAMAGGLEKEIIAEGVETEEQLDFLLREGCFNIQGFYYSKPLPEEEALKLLSREEN